jgi:hypothetical protein
MGPDDDTLRAPPDQIRSHGHTVDTLVERVAGTRAAATSVGYDMGSYGLINSWMPRLLDDLVGRAVADQYVAADSAADATVRNIR